MQSINLQPGAVWQINRPIVLEFNRAVDFASVNLNTINVRQPGGAPSAGEFFLQAPHVVVFQPRCPTLDDLSDAGLLPGGVDYELRLLGLDDAQLTVRAADGQPLAEGETRAFRTPLSSLPAVLFFDPTPGPPTAVVRTSAPGDERADATYVEIGGDPDQRHYFERDVATGAITLDPPLELPLNLLSQQASQVAIVLHLNQPVDPSTSNVSPQRLLLQYRDQLGLWRALGSEVRLEGNCTRGGAVVRLEPEGILPPGTAVRAAITTQFRDLVGQTHLVQQDAFARADVAPAPAPLFDEHLEGFADAALLDAAVAFAVPPAEWGVGGTLRAAFSFSGSGGPGGDFDWRVPAGTTFVFDTISESIQGGPGFANTKTQTVVGGVLDVRDLRVEAGATLAFIGPNPVTILASGRVEILGAIDVGGTSSPGVNSLNTTNTPEPGAAGQCGGGRGGTGSPLITASSPKGGNGFGAFGQPDGGGVGGEAGWNGDAGFLINHRRGAGGGGGVLGANQPASVGGGPWDQTLVGLDAEPGFFNFMAPSGNTSGSKGAITGAPGPQGGAVGPGPFVDGDPTNDFFGTLLDTAHMQLVRGELKKPWAGAGGGGGGDASFVGIGGSFPMSPFNPNGDEKGAGGGGGGGSLRIQALRDIAFGPAGRIRARGGAGGGGENTLQSNRVGGGSGGGSGGHVVLESAGRIDLSQVALAPNGLDAAILATGGQGGAGEQDKGGASGTNETVPFEDACPPGHPAMGQPNGCLGHVDGAGGDGGPGIVQLHTPKGLDPLAPDVLLPTGATLADLCKPTPVCSAAGCNLLPSFARASRARSRWIALGEGGFDPASPLSKRVVFDFGGIDPATGLVLTSGGKVVQLPPLLGPLPLAGAPALPHIAPGGTTLVAAAAPLAATHPHLLDNTDLLKGHLIELAETAAPASAARFAVAAAVHDAAAGTLRLTVDAAGPSLASFAPPGPLQVALRPAYFRVLSDGAPDSLPDSATVLLRFQATVPDAAGDPDPAGATPLVSDVGVLNSAATNPSLRFVRFDVLFDIDAQATGLDPQKPIPALDHLRMPFRYD